MTTMTTQDERSTQDHQDDVQGYFGPLVLVAGALYGAAAAIAIGFSGPTVPTYDTPAGSAGGKDGVGGWCPV